MNSNTESDVEKIKRLFGAVAKAVDIPQKYISEKIYFDEEDMNLIIDEMIEIE